MTKARENPEVAFIVIEFSMFEIHRHTARTNSAQLPGISLKGLGARY